MAHDEGLYVWVINANVMMAPMPHGDTLLAVVVCQTRIYSNGNRAEIQFSIQGVPEVIDFAWRGDRDDMGPI